MYTVQDRSELLNELVEKAKNIKEVQGFILVGSGAKGFRDEYSDLDVLVVVEESVDVEKVHDNLLKFMEKNYKILKSKIYKHEEDIFVTCFFLDNYLELDLGVWSYNKLKATKPHWRILFDNKDNIKEKLQQSLKKHDTPEANEIANYSLTYIWQFIQGTVVELKRSNLIKAIKNLDVFRDDIIKILCVKNGIYYDYDKNINSINSEFVQRLKETYEIAMTVEIVSKRFTEVVELYFEVIESISNTKDVKKYKETFINYVKKML